jgi:uncharacterized protein YhfF
MLDGILQGCVENLVDALVDLILSGVKQGTATATIGHEHLKIACAEQYAFVNKIAMRPAS